MRLVSRRRVSFTCRINKGQLGCKKRGEMGWSFNMDLMSRGTQGNCLHLNSNFAHTIVIGYRF